MTAALAACQKDSGTSVDSGSKPTFKAQTAAKKGPSVDELTSGMVLAAPVGKSPLALDLKFDLAARPKQGQSLDVDLAMLPQVAGGPIDLQVNNSDGFTIADSAAFELAEVQSGEVYRHTVRVTPTGEGVLLLGVTISLKHDDVSDAKSFSIPIIVQH